MSHRHQNQILFRIYTARHSKIVSPCEKTLLLRMPASQSLLYYLFCRNGKTPPWKEICQNQNSTVAFLFYPLPVLM